VIGWNDSSFWVNPSTATGITRAWKAVTWAGLGVSVEANKLIGLDVGCNDDDDGSSRDSQLMWKGTGDNWGNTPAFGRYSS
jgi:hypothetical protein